jgi:FAD:protein FMN transferase
MGVRTTIAIYADDRDAASTAANLAFLRIAELDQVLSDWQGDSETARLDEYAGLGAVPISADLAFALETSLGIAAASDGLFDPTVGPLVREWRAMRSTGVLVSSERLHAVRELVGWRLVHLDVARRTASLERAGMRLDFGGIGKGLAAQAALERLRELGFPCALVALAGDVAVGAAPPRTKGWSIAVPSVAGSKDEAAVLVLVNAAVSTSGETEQFVEIDGRRYAHIVDPRTGLGAVDARTATIVAPRGELADALATAAALGTDATIRALVERFPDTAAIVVERDGTRTVLDPKHALVWRDGAPRP